MTTYPSIHSSPTSELYDTRQDLHLDHSRLYRTAASSQSYLHPLHTRLLWPRTFLCKLIVDYILSSVHAVDYDNDGFFVVGLFHKSLSMVTMQKIP